MRSIIVTLTARGWGFNFPLLPTARQPGFLPLSTEVPLADTDLEVDATLKAIPQWTVSLEAGNEFLVAAQYRLGTGPWFLEGALASFWPTTRWSSNVLDFDPNVLHLPLGPLTDVQWMQAEAGAFWYGSKPEDGFVWGFDALAQRSGLTFSESFSTCSVSMPTA